MTAPVPAELLRDLFDAAVARADPRIAVPRHLPARPEGRTVVIGAGKAAAAMARAAAAPSRALIATQTARCCLSSKRSYSGPGCSR